MEHRHDTEIIKMILESARGGATRTKIMYKAYLSQSQVVNYIKILQENYLVAFDQGKELYITTEKGIKFLNSSGDINYFMTNKLDIKNVTEINFKDKDPSSEQDSFFN